MRFDEGMVQLRGISPGTVMTVSMVGAVWSLGQLGRALSFDGNDYVDAASAALDGQSNVSGGFLVKNERLRPG